MLLVCLGVLIALQTVISFRNVNDLCLRCANTASNESIVGQNCYNITNASVVGGCCVQNTSNDSIVIGLDWSRCNITKLNSYQFQSIGDSLQWLDLSGNNIQFSASRHDRWFGALTKLKLLLLPSGVYCDEKAWHANKTFCMLQLCSDPLNCSVLDSHSHNITNSSVCPPESHCIPDGPGLHQCVCNSDRHGYKCIQHTGSFPYAVFFSASVGATLAIIVVDRIMRWLTRYAGRERRHDCGVQ